MDVLVKDRNLLGMVANGREFLQGVDSGREKDLRRATKTGRPWVDHEHLARMEKKTGHNLQKGNPGRKPPDSMNKLPQDKLFLTACVKTDREALLPVLFR